jgi:hypothetical protein
LKIYGDGYDDTAGYGDGSNDPPTNYKVYWRIDTDILGADPGDTGTDKYEVHQTSSYAPVSTESEFVPDGTTDSDGAQWRTFDSAQPSKTVSIGESFTTDNPRLWILQFLGISKSSAGELDIFPDNYDNNGENVSIQDDVYWYKADRPGSQCNSSTPCLVGPTLYLTGL